MGVTSDKDQDEGILGRTDDTPIGNIGDALKVSSAANSAGGSPVLSSKLRIEADLTGLTMTASYQTAFTYTGSGKLTGFDLTFDKSGADVKLTIDSTEVIFDMSSDDLQSLLSGKVFAGVPLDYDNTKNSFVFSPTYAVVYESQVKIEVKRGTGTADLTGYLISLTKET